MSGPEIKEFLTHLAVKRQVSASTQNQALNAVVFLFKHILGKEPVEFKAVRAKHREYLPVVLPQAEGHRVLPRRHSFSAISTLPPAHNPPAPRWTRVDHTEVLVAAMAAVEEAQGILLLQAGHCDNKTVANHPKGSFDLFPAYSSAILGDILIWVICIIIPDFPDENHSSCIMRHGLTA